MPPDPAAVFTPATFGTVVGVRQATGVHVTDLIHRSYARLAPHCHDDPTIVLVLSGGVTESIGRHAFTCRPGSVLIKPAAVRHADTYSREPTRCVVIQLATTSRLADRYPEVFGRVRHLERVGSLVGSLLSSETIEHEVVRLLDALVQLVGTPRRSLTGDDTLRSIRDHLLADPRERVPLQQLARSAGLSASALTHAFRRRYGCTPSAVRRRRRLEHAVALCADDTLQLSGVAYAAGFADQAHFTREFKTLMGETPARYRLRTRQVRSRPGTGSA